MNGSQCECIFQVLEGWIWNERRKQEKCLFPEGGSGGTRSSDGVVAHLLTSVHDAERCWQELICPSVCFHLLPAIFSARPVSKVWSVIWCSLLRLSFVCLPMKNIVLGRINRLKQTRILSHLGLVRWPLPLSLSDSVRRLVERSIYVYVPCSLVACMWLSVGLCDGSVVCLVLFVSVIVCGSVWWVCERERGEEAMAEQRIQRLLIVNMIFHNAFRWVFNAKKIYM